MKIKEHGEGSGYYSFICPGCGSEHAIPTKGANPWGFNGSVDSPTFTPSILVTGGHYVTGQEGKPCWCTYNTEQIAKGEEPSGFQCLRCHSYVTDGKIQYLSDCSHSLAGQTVELPNIE